MIGITLSDEQIHNAPGPVREWIEQQVAASLGLAPPAPVAAPAQAAHLVACGRQEAAALLEQIQNIPPAVNVLFEFARPGIAFGEPPVMTYRLVDLQYHAQLTNVGEVIECLEAINRGFVRVLGDPSALFCGFDNEGHCLIAPATHKGIAALWQDMVALPPRAAVA